MANNHFSFTEKIRIGAWSTSAWQALIRWLNDRFTAVETAFDGMPTDAQIATLTAIDEVTPADSVILVGDGTNFVGESGSTARTSLGVGSGDDVGFQSATVTIPSANYGFTHTTGSGTPAIMATYVNETSGVWIGSRTNHPLNFYVNDSGSLVSIDASGNIALTGTIELGHASDTTLARSSAGDLAVEGNLIYRAGGTDVPVTDGGTGASTPAAARTSLGVDPAGTDNSTDVTLAGTPDYLTLAGQVITRALINLTSHVTGILPLANGGTGASTKATAATAIGVGTGDSPAFAGLTVDTTTIVVDTANNRVGVGTASPAEALDVTGDISVSTDMHLGNDFYQGSDKIIDDINHLITDTKSGGQMASITHAANTSGKYKHKFMINSITKEVFYATGGAAGDVWISFDGGTTITPV